MHIFVGNRLETLFENVTVCLPQVQFQVQGFNLQIGFKNKKMDQDLFSTKININFFNLLKR